MAIEHSMELVRRAVEEIWNGGDLAVADVLFAPTYVNHGGLIPDLVRGPEAIKVGVTLYRTAFPGLHITVEALVAQGELVELQWTARRPPPAARGGLARAGSTGTLTGTLLSRCTGGQIAESWTQWDSGEVLRHLGIVRADAARGADPDAPREQPDG